MSDANTMPYRMLGRTGLQVSVFSYGFWATFGVKEGLTDDAGIERAMECLRVARAGGVNLFDNAEVYGSPRGEAERIMGEAIARLRLEDPEGWRRSDILITTKIFWGGDGVNEKGLSRKHQEVWRLQVIRTMGLETSMWGKLDMVVRILQKHFLQQMSLRSSLI